MKNCIVTILAFFLASFGFSQDVKLTHNLPSSANPGQTINAEFTVTKGNIGAFAKFQCDLPGGFDAQAGDTKSGNFTFENGRVKIVWVSLPADPTFTFSFKITTPASGGSVNLTAQFYYLENNVKKEFDIPPHIISISGGAVASNPDNNTGANTGGNAVNSSTTTATETKTNPAETTPAETKTITATTTETNTTAPTETKTIPVETKTAPTETKTTKTSTSRAGVTYYIQVAALSTDPGPGTMYKKYGKVKVVIENGMYKVLIGAYNSLEEARGHKPEMTNKGAEGCFVVGYENGVRIKL